MPYSETPRSGFVASALATASLIRMNAAIPFYMLYPKMHLPRVDLHGKTAIVTGANSGIGYECARALAGMGARVVLACRTESKGNEAKRMISADTGNDMVEMELLDCASFDSVKAFVERWGTRESRKVDILINNAGGLTHTLEFTSDGYEQTYQSNHLSHVLLTFSLLNRGYMSPDARIVSVSSNAFYETEALDLSNADNSDVIAKYNAKAGATLEVKEMRDFYRRSKASQAVWAMVLQRHLSRTERWKDITVHSCHPGCVNSLIWSQPGGAGSMVGFQGKALIAFATTVGITNEQGAVVPVWLATATEPASQELRGMFWDRMKWKWVWPWSLETKRQSELWDKWCKDTQISLLI